jgi:hypothetical protein
VNSVIPCPNPDGCNWPACPLDCKWRPGRQEPKDVYYWPPGSNWRTATCTVSELELEQMERDIRHREKDQAMDDKIWNAAMATIQSLRFQLMDSAGISDHERRMIRVNLWVALRELAAHVKDEA